MNTLPHIGTIEHIAIPSHGVENLPAKVDTGADSSALWASNISETEQGLSFRLFDRTSPHYTGETITAKDFKVSLIKNSFGHTERRYKVVLKIMLAGKTIDADFTLANREGNTYPALIGRKTLHGTFLVDVAKEPEAKTRHVLMLSTKRTNTTAAFAENIQKSAKNIKITYAAYEDLRYVLGGEQNKITLGEDGQDIATFDMVYFKTTSRLMDVAAATARYLEARNVPFVDQAIKHFPATSKLYQYVLLTDDGSLQVPKSIFILPTMLPKSHDYITAKIGSPFVLKDIHGNKGEHNYMVRSQRDFDEAVAKLAADDVQAIAQSFVPNDCDYRVLMFERKVALVIKRTRNDDKTHLNNTSQGAQAVIVPATTFPTEVRTACGVGAKLMEREIAGVDIVKDKETGVWYCLEVNDGPQLASGSFKAEKHRVLAEYLERKLRSV